MTLLLLQHQGHLRSWLLLLLLLVLLLLLLLVLLLLVPLLLLLVLLVLLRMLLEGVVLTMRAHHSVKCEALPVSSSWVSSVKVEHAVHAGADLEDLVWVLCVFV
jgi:hypothetical protein